jgi:chromosome segregation ATPase
MVPRADYLAATADAKAAREDVDSKASDIAALEQQVCRAKGQLESALGDLVPRSELQAAEGRCELLEARAARTTGEHRKELEEVNDRLREQLAANEKLSKTLQVVQPPSHRAWPTAADTSRALQSMVPRAELVAALAEVRASRDEAQAQASDLASAEDRLQRAQELLKAARAESSRLQAALAGSVPRAELLAAKAKIEEADMRTQAARDELHARLKEWEAEESRLRSTMQVLWWLSVLLTVICPNEHAFYRMVRHVPEILRDSVV